MMREVLVNEICNKYKEHSTYHNAVAVMKGEIKVKLLIKMLRQLLYPEILLKTDLNSLEFKLKIEEIYHELKKEIAIIYGNAPEREIQDLAEQVISKLPQLHELAIKDMEAAFEGDPAAENYEEIAACYPGILAINVHRFSHVLYEMGVPFLPRRLNEKVHSETGIDIHPGAVIGEYFFIDHGTGIVIGETTEIGNHAKIYQGVTLGALSTRGGQKLKNVKRHPTIEHNVTIYAGASILGGNTVVGEQSVIGSNAFITESVPAQTKVGSNALCGKHVYQSVHRGREHIYAEGGSAAQGNRKNEIWG
ncbi:MAG: serine acetyltransferase [Muricomes sp.]